MTPYEKDQLDWLRARFPGYEFWHVSPSNGPDAWCWKPLGSDDGRDSQERGTFEEVCAAITGTEDQIRMHAAPGTRP